MMCRLVLALVGLLVACDTSPDRERSTLARPSVGATARPVTPDTLDDIDTSSPDSIDNIDSTDPDTSTTDTSTTDTSTTDTTSDTTSDTTTTDTDTTDTTSDTDTATTTPCQVGAVSGTCRHLADCEDDEFAVEGFCDGHPRVRCCLPAWDRCSSESRPGACLDTADCPGPDWATSSGLCPGPAEVRCCTTSAPAAPCDPALRPDPNTGLVEEPGDPGCPPGMAFIAGPPTFCIDRFEASLVLDTSPGTHLSPYHNPGSTAVRAVSLRYAVPQGYIDQVRSKAACERANKRLCSSSEWLFACQGSTGNSYPYGPTRQPGVCNDARRQHVAVEFFPDDPNRFSKIDNACLSQLPNSVDLTGENDGCVTSSGVYDLMGNVHEWIDDPAGTFRGGFFSDTSINGNGCLYRTTAHDVNHWDYSTGFRCCADL